MRRLLLAVSACLLFFGMTPSFALAGFVSFAGLDRETVISAAGQTFTWTSDGYTGTVTVRPAGPITYLNPTVPNTANNRGPFSIFHTGVRSPGGPVDVSFEFLFSQPINITVYNTETLAGREVMTLQTDGDPWTGGWYSATTGNIVGLGSRTVAMSTSGPTPPHPYFAFSSIGVTRLEYTNALNILSTQTGSIGNGIEIEINAVPEPTSVGLVAVGFGIILCRRSIGRRYFSGKLM
jgi:hypothetical protein